MHDCALGAWEGGDCMIVHWEHGRVVTACLNFNLASESDPQKNQKGGLGKWAWVEVYTAPGMQAHF